MNTFICVYGQPEFVNVCFWFVPPSMRGKERSADYQDKLAKVSFCFQSLHLKHKHTFVFVVQPLYHLWFVCFVNNHEHHYFHAVYFLPLTVPIHFTLLLTGSSSHQGADDEKRYYDGWVPTFGKQGQLFPHGCGVSTGLPERHGFLS